jgi:hypothetical protein
LIAGGFTPDNHAQVDCATGPLTHHLLAGVDYGRFAQSSTFRSGLTTSIDAYAPVCGDFTAPDAQENPDERQTRLGVYVRDQITCTGFIRPPRSDGRARLPA